QATFSACFGAAFMVWHPTKYASLLAERMKRHGSQAWLVNTGWTGGAYGHGDRIKLAYTRAIIDAIHSRELDEGPMITDPIFGLEFPQHVPGVPDEILNPINTWSDTEQFQATAEKLAHLFRENFAQYEDAAAVDVRAVAPRAEAARAGAGARS